MQGLNADFQDLGFHGVQVCASQKNKNIQEPSWAGGSRESLRVFLVSVVFFLVCDCVF